MSNHFKCLAFDYGLRYTGIAVGHVISKVATPLEVILMDKGEPNWQELASIIKEWQPDIFLVGCPLSQEGQEQAMTTKARLFAKKITSKFNIQTKMVDERYTTLAAKDIVFQQQGSRGLRKSRVDAYSALIICQQWMQEQE